MKILNKITENLKQGKTLIIFTSLQALVMAVPLIVAKFLTKDMWDRYSICESVILFFSALFFLSARNPVIVYANEERSKTGTIHKTFSIQCIFLITSIILFLAIILIFRNFIAKTAEIKMIELFYVALAFFAFILKDFAGNLFMALNQRIRNSLVEVSFGIFTLSFMLVFFLLKRIELKSVFLSYFFASLIVLIGVLSVIDFKVLLPFVFDKKHFSKMLVFTFWGMAGAISSYLISVAGVLLLRYFGNIGESGTYNFANKFSKGFTVLIYIASGYFLPHLSENIDNPQKIKAYLFHKRPLILLLGGLCFTLAWVIIPYAIDVVYPGKFIGAGHIVKILILGSFAFLYTAMYFPLFVALKRYKFIQIIILTQLILYFVFSLIMIPHFKLSGAAIATVISYFYLALIFEFYYRITIKKMIQ